MTDRALVDAGLLVRDGCDYVLTAAGREEVDRICDRLGVPRRSVSEERVSTAQQYACDWCGGEVWRIPSAVGEHVYCSHDCEYAYRRANKVDRARPMKPGGRSHKRRVES
jgi:hypothetical protein